MPFIPCPNLHPCSVHDAHRGGRLPLRSEPLDPPKNLFSSRPHCKAIASTEPFAAAPPPVPSDVTEEWTTSAGTRPPKTLQHSQCLCCPYRAPDPRQCVSLESTSFQQTKRATVACAPTSRSLTKNAKKKKKKKRRRKLRPHGGGSLFAFHLARAAEPVVLPVRVLFDFFQAVLLLLLTWAGAAPVECPRGVPSTFGFTGCRASPRGLFCHDQSQSKFADASRLAFALVVQRARMASRGMSRTGCCFVGDRAYCQSASGSSRSVLAGASASVSAALPSAAQCRPSSSSCDFYSCVEDALQCQRGPASDSYPIQYGLKYCRRFSALRLNARGTRWAEVAHACLQVQLASFLRANPRPTCAALTKFAFASHPRCYTQPGASICDLDPVTQARVALTVDTHDLVSVRSAIQVGAVARTCAVEIARDGVDLGRRIVRGRLEAGGRFLDDVR